MASVTISDTSSTSTQLRWRESVGQELPRLHVMKASSLVDAGSAINLVRSREVVLLDCAALEPRLAQRLLDMVSGGLAAIDGQLHRIGPSLLLASPALTPVQTI
ncbi:MAG: cell division protein SepF [Cyanobacteriota bacterium]|nr:cell division protein SepF [Cyanobacteriota bacterium]